MPTHPIRLLFLISIVFCYIGSSKQTIPFWCRLLISPMLDQFLSKHFLGLIFLVARQRFIIHERKFLHFKRQFFIIFYGSHFFTALLQR